MRSLLIQEHGSGINRLRSDVETKRLRMRFIPIGGTHRHAPGSYFGLPSRLVRFGALVV